MLLCSMFAWLGMMLLAILNGLIRERFYSYRFGELAAHQVSTVTLLLLLAGYVVLLAQFWSLRTITEALITGVLWLVMTLAFEWGFGRYVAGHSWQRLLADYNLTAGRIWVLIPLWMLIAPLLFLVRR